MAGGAEGGVGGAAEVAARYNQRMEYVTIAILLIEIVGFILGGVVLRHLLQQIGALKGTIQAQAETIRTLGELNKAALEMTKAFDPKKYAELVTVHQELVEKNAAAVIEEKRRELERERQKSQEAAGKTLEMAMRMHESTLQAAFELVAYVAPDRRSQAIAEMPQSLREVFLQFAAKAPDLSRAPAKLMSLSEVLGAQAETPLPLRAKPS